MVLAAVDPVDTYIIVDVLAGAVLPVVAIVIPFTINEPVSGLINGAKLAALRVIEAVVPTLLDISELVAAVKVPLATLATNNVSPPLLK
jgi:hypothetical protein